MSWHNFTRRTTFALALGVVASATVLFAPIASAHVTVSPGTAEPGGYARVVFRVPNERENASTTRLEVSLPTDHRFRSVSVQPVPGWTAVTTKEKSDQPVAAGEEGSTDVVTAIAWEGGAVLPGQFQEFPVSLGPLPKTDGKLVFKAVQTYSNGEVVRWIDLQQDGADRPEHPAPTLKVAAAPAPQAAPAPPPSGGADPLGRVLGGIGLVAGLAALGVALTTRRRSAPAPVPVEPAGKSPARV
ncbi:YcnI family copper-binding membrane protein [Saccharothrix stipae]